jgi:UTP-glucose-1-phosphate uridylyltransferase
VLALVADFRLVDGKLAMPVDTLVARVDALTAQPKQQRERYFEDVVVLAARLARTNPGAASQAVAQLLALATLLISDRQRAQKAFAASGVAVKAARRFLGDKVVTQVAPQVEARVRTDGFLSSLKANRAASDKNKRR